MPQAPGNPEIAFHTNYGGNQGQVVCCSLTLEFYKVNHSVEPRLIWNGETHTFLATIAVIKRLLIQPFYKGRST